MNVSLQTIQEYANNILKYIDEVCERHGVTYYLYAGTLLGAVRHQGFIPWDDDIDIAMTRPEFEKFHQAMQMENHERYRLCWLGSEERWTSPLPKVIDTYTKLNQSGHREEMDLGIYVDVFILDVAPVSEYKRQLWWKRVDILRKVWGGCEYVGRVNANNWKVKLKESVSGLMASVIGPRRAAYWIDNEAGRYDGKADSVGLSNAVFRSYSWEKSSTTLEILGNGCRLTFGDRPYNCPEHYDEFLRNLYGDYMQLPPEDQRVPGHTNEITFLNQE